MMNATALTRQNGLKDIADSLQRPGLWLYLGIRDVFLEHARAALGLLWPLIGALAWITVIYNFLGMSLREDHEDYLAYLTIGIVCYNFASGILVNGAMVFQRFKGIILNIPNPLFVFPLRVTTKIAFMTSLQVIFVVGALIICNKPVTSQMLQLIPALAAYLVTGVFLSLVMGILGLRFGDLSFLMRTIMRLMLFATPIFWYPAETGARKLASLYNPLAHYIEIIRAPLLGYPPDNLSVMVVAGSTVLVTVAGLILFHSGRNEIARRL